MIQTRLKLPTFSSRVAMQILVLLLGIWILSFPKLVLANQATEISWDDLVPEDWNPNSVFEQYSYEELNAMTDEQYYSLEEQFQKILDASPTVDGLDGKKVRIPGYMLPLEYTDTSIKEFLLVPYFGACVHTPPPPANQIIHGKIENQLFMSELFEPVWISGTIQTIRSKSSLGESGVDETLLIDTGYSMTVDEVELYDE